MISYSLTGIHTFTLPDLRAASQHAVSRSELTVVITLHSLRARQCKHRIYTSFKMIYSLHMFFFNVQSNHQSYIKFSILYNSSTSINKKKLDQYITTLFSSLINRGTSTANEITEAPPTWLIYCQSISGGGGRGYNAGHMETKRKDRISPIS